ncbi:hypothetical protein SLA2020_217270 [Shorea laevis]
MEEEKAVAYYNELTRRGEGAARFKQGLGFSSNDDRKDAIPERGSVLPSSSSFLSTFVRASSPSSTSKHEKQSQLQSIQNKLKKKPEKEPWVSERSSHRDRSRSRERDRDRDRDRDRHSRRRSRSRSRSRERRRRRSRSRSPRHRRSEKRRSRSRSRSRSPRERRRSEREGKATKERNGEVDYSRLIEGYDKMSAAERVKAKMKLQLAETAEKDPTRGMGSGWEWFEFNKDAPLDDEEVEAAGDDAAILKHIGQSFRFSAIETRRGEQIKAAHDEAIFGSSTVPVSVTVNSESEEEDKKKDSNNNGLAANLLSERVLAKQPGSWRDRVRKA